MALLALSLDLVVAALPITEEVQDENEKEVWPDYCDQGCENGSEGIACDKDCLTEGVVSVHVGIVWIWILAINVKVELVISRIA
jgi:hypothetical protein